MSQSLLVLVNVILSLVKISLHYQISFLFIVFSILATSLMELMCRSVIVLRATSPSPHCCQYCWDQALLYGFKPGEHLLGCCVIRHNNICDACMKLFASLSDTLVRSMIIYKYSNAKFVDMCFVSQCLPNILRQIAQIGY